MWKVLLNAVTGLLGNGIQNAVNVKQQRETNKHNEKLVQMQNQATAEQANLSYQRSRADNQVANLMNAGMSRAGAINVLNGGGHYQPAPVNTSQANAPQIDTSSAINAIQAATQLAENKRQFDKGYATQRDMQDKQIASNERMQKAQLESNERIAQLQADTTNRNADNRLGFDREVWNKNSQLVDKNIEQVIANINKTNKETESIDLDNVRKQLENENYPTLARLTNEKLQGEINVLAKQALKIQEETDYTKKQTEILQLQKRFTEFTQKHQVDALNAANELIAYMANNDLSMLKYTKAKDFMYSLIFIMKYCMPSLFKPN